MARLLQHAQDAREAARNYPPGKKRETLLRQARASETAAQIDGWIASPGAASAGVGTSGPYAPTCSRAATQSATKPAQTSRMTSSASAHEGWKERPHSMVKLRILLRLLSMKCLV